MSALRDMAEAISAQDWADRNAAPPIAPVSLEPWMFGPLRALSDPGVTGLVMAGYGLRGIMEGRFR